MEKKKKIGVGPPPPHPAVRRDYISNLSLYFLRRSNRRRQHDEASVPVRHPRVRPDHGQGAEEVHAEAGGHERQHVHRQHRRRHRAEGVRGHVHVRVRRAGLRSDLVQLGDEQVVEAHAQLPDARPAGRRLQHRRYAETRCGHAFFPSRFGPTLAPSTIRTKIHFLIPVFVQMNFNEFFFFFPSR